MAKPNVAIIAALMAAGALPASARRHLRPTEREAREVDERQNLGETLIARAEAKRLRKAAKRLAFQAHAEGEGNG